ncbi:MAG: hypothetical protein K0S24_54 [Sphingobacterium sp.]|jgi:hypothetical protein|nr:hypothetical protein [Sphingobacterium sp.]
MKSFKVKTLFCVLIAWVICLQATNLLWVFVAYECNQDYIEQNLCVYRYEPAATCKGFCYLSEKTVEQKDVSDVLIKVKSAEILLFVQLVNPLTWEQPFSLFLKLSCPPTKDKKLCEGTFMRIFKPPIV